MVNLPNTGIVCLKELLKTPGCTGAMHPTSKLHLVTAKLQQQPGRCCHSWTVQWSANKKGRVGGRYSKRHRTGHLGVAFSPKKCLTLRLFVHSFGLSLKETLLLHHFLVTDPRFGHNETAWTDMAPKRGLLFAIVSVIISNLNHPLRSLSFNKNLDLRQCVAKKMSELSRHCNRAGDTHNRCSAKCRPLTKQMSDGMCCKMGSSKICLWLHPSIKRAFSNLSLYRIVHPNPNPQPKQNAFTDFMKKEEAVPCNLWL